MGPNTYRSKEEIKALRVQIDACVLEARKRGTWEIPTPVDNELYDWAEAQVIHNLIQAKMWAGKMLEGLGNPFPAELADKADVQ